MSKMLFVCADTTGVIVTPKQKLMSRVVVRVRDDAETGVAERKEWRAEVSALRRDARHARTSDGAPLIGWSTRLPLVRVSIDQAALCFRPKLSCRCAGHCISHRTWR